jgi:HSP20 family protein
MTLVRRPSPFGELVSLRQAMDRLFDDSFGSRPWAAAWNGSEALAMPLDVTRDADALKIEAALPGIKPEDVDVTVEDGTLTISAKHRTEREEKNDAGEVLVQEIRRGSVTRSIALPTGLEPDQATATFEDGVLTLRIPKSEAVKPRQIRISPTTHGTSQSPAGETAGTAGEQA